MKSRKDLLGRVLIPAIVLGCLTIPVAVLAARLPGQVAVHWGGLAGGRVPPTGHLPVWAWGAGAAALWCASWATLKPLSPPFPRERDRAFGVYTVAGLLLAGTVAVLTLNAGHRSWQEASAAWPVLLLGGVAALLCTLALGWAGAVLSGTAEPASPPPAAGVRLPGQRVAWSGSARNYLAWPAAITILLAATLAGGSLARMAIGIAASAAVACLSVVTVVAGPHGVTAAMAPWGWPRWHTAIVEIRQARSFRLVALAYRGWGWRRVPGGRAWIVRSGDALELEFRNGRRFVVTVDHAADAAALVNDYLRDQGHDPGAPTAGGAALTGPGSAVPQ